MAKGVYFDVIRKLIAVSIVLSSTSAQAQNCRQYPPGPFRLQCAEAIHPMGLSRSALDSGMKDYVHACMQRR